MPADEIKLLAQFAVTNGTTAVYVTPTSPPNTRAIIKAIHVVNTGPGVATVKLSMTTVPLTNVVTMQAGGWGDYDGTLTMGQGDSLFVIATGGTVAGAVHGMEVS